MQKKIKTLVKTLMADSGAVTLKLSLLADETHRKTSPVYGISAETEDDFSLTKISTNLSDATAILNTLFEGEVTPVTLNDIISDLYADNTLCV